MNTNKVALYASYALALAAAIINIALSVMMVLAMIEVYGFMLTAVLWIGSILLAIASAWLAYDEGKSFKKAYVVAKDTLKSVATRFQVRKPRVIAKMSDGTEIREGDFVPQI